MRREEWMEKNKERLWSKYRAGVDKVFELMRRLGGVVSEEWEEARKEKCEGCDYNGEVEPMPGVVVEGCEECGCPFETKRTMKTLMGIMKIECTHPEGNRWEAVDIFFKNKK